jgi:hypothetical protein
LIFGGLCQSADALLEFFGKCRDTLHRFRIADPPRQIAVPMSLRDKAGDCLPLIHCVPPSKLKRWSLKIVQTISDSKRTDARSTSDPKIAAALLEMAAESLIRNR